jgi:hypothetical protein
MIASAKRSPLALSRATWSGRFRYDGCANFGSGQPRCRIITFEGAYQKLIGETEGAFPSSLCTIQEIKMKLAVIGAAAVAAAAFATPALAQQVIEDPGYCAQFYPNANCQNLGPGNPYTNGGYYRNNWRNSNASIAPRLHHHKRTHHG